MINQKWMIIGIFILISGFLIISCDDEEKVSFNYDNTYCDSLIPDTIWCSLPFPSDKYMIKDSSTQTGYRLNFSQESMPYNTSEDSIFNEEYNRFDGYSAVTPILMYFPDIDITNLPSQTNMELSITDDSPTLIIDYDTGEKIPHFAELDEHYEDNHQKLLILRLSERLKDGQKYIVALRNIYDSSGNLIEASDGFRYLRDGIITNNSNLEARRTGFNEMISKLQDYGINTNELTLSWYFVTASSDCITGRMLHMIENAFSRQEVTGGIEIDIEVSTSGTGNYYKFIDGTFTVPLYLDKDGPGGKFVLDENNMPVCQGSYAVPFHARIPQSATDGHSATDSKLEKARLLQYGHGLFDSGEAIDYTAVSSLSNDYNFITFATDWKGMCIDDVANIAGVLANIKRFPEIADSLQQGMLNSLLLAHMMKTTFQTYDNGSLVAEVRTSGTETGSNAIRDEVYYYGYSQGGTFGSTYLALSDYCSRGVLGVPGMAYSMMLDRSVDFGYLEPIMQGAYPDSGKRLLIIAFIQMLWDRGEASGYGHHATIQENLFDSRELSKAILLMGVNDHQVPNIATFFMARTMNASYMDYNTTSPYNIAAAGAPFDGTAIVDFLVPEAPEVPLTNARPEGEPDPHTYAQNYESIKEMIALFLKPDGLIYHTCNGACDTSD